MFCGKCGRQIMDRSAFCVYCGSAVVRSQPEMQGSTNQTTPTPPIAPEQQDLQQPTNQQPSVSEYLPTSNIPSQPTYQAPSEPSCNQQINNGTQKKKSKVGLFITLGSIVLLIAVLATVWFANLFGIQDMIMGNKTEKNDYSPYDAEEVQSFDEGITFNKNGRVNRVVYVNETGINIIEYEYDGDAHATIRAHYYDKAGKLIDREEFEFDANYYYHYDNGLYSFFANDGSVQYSIIYEEDMTTIGKIEFSEDRQIRKSFVLYFDEVSDILDDYAERNEVSGSWEPTVEIQTEPTEAPHEQVIQLVALITDLGTIDDESYNQACWEGIAEWCNTNGVAYTYYQPTGDSNAERVACVDRAVAEGANVIVMPGYLFGTVLIEVQDVYPDVRFIALDVSSGDLTYDYLTFYEPSPNSVCITYREEQSGYLAGYAAVKEGYTKLGFLGGMAVPAIVRYGYGFIQGADAAAAEMGVNIEINYTYGGQFFGSPDITAKMDSWYANGTEVVFACGGGIFTSVAEAAIRYDGARVIGVDVDQQRMIDDMYGNGITITSAMKDLSQSVQFMLEEIEYGDWDDTYGGTFTVLSLSDGRHLGLPTDTWSMQNFSIAEYEEVIAEIAEGWRYVSDAIDDYPYTTNTTIHDV